MPWFVEVGLPIVDVLKFGQDVDTDRSRIVLYLVVVELIVPDSTYTTLLLVDCKVTATSLESFTGAVCASVIGSTDPSSCHILSLSSSPLVTAST